MKASIWHVFPNRDE